MGLKERRAAKQFEDGAYPQLASRLYTAAGYEPEVSVAWDQLAEDGMTHMYDEAWPKVYFEPLIKAVEEICEDEMGRDALRATLTKVIIKNEGDIIYGDRMATFERGVLTLDHKPTTNISDVQTRIDGIVNVLSNAL